VADGLLLTRRERLKLFGGRLGGGLCPPLLLALVVAALGGGAVADRKTTRLNSSHQR